MSLSSKNCPMSTFSIPVSILKVSIRSPLILLLSSVVSPSLCNLDSYGNFFNLDIILVAVL